ncbi:unnamed protein product [Polarella glacialis]|uniref:EF-hand domain-containing protein n=1 Tax=Polarella glacialis TaxID=89957 RepID=A0A813F4T7_POLGL|nr:unnamed protein product [Polarella glacialis]
MPPDVGDRDSRSDRPLGVESKASPVESEFQRLLSGLLAQHVQEVSVLQGEVLRLRAERDEALGQNSEGRREFSIDAFSPEEKKLLQTLKGDENEALQSFNGRDMILSDLPLSESDGSEALRSFKGREGDGSEALRSFKGREGDLSEALRGYKSRKVRGDESEALRSYRRRKVRGERSEALRSFKRPSVKSDGSEALRSFKARNVVSIDRLPSAENGVDSAPPPSPEGPIRRVVTQLLDTLDQDSEVPAELLQTPSKMELSKNSSRLQNLEQFLESDKFEILISLLLCANVLFLALELQFHGLIEGYRVGFYDTPYPREEDWVQIDFFFYVGDLVFTAIFCIDVTVRIVVLRSKFWRKAINWLDFVVVATSVISLLQSLDVSPMFLRLLRIAKLTRALRLVTTSHASQSLQILLKCLASSVDTLFWSFLLLVFIQIVAGMVIANLASEFISDSSNDPKMRRQVFILYGTFTRTFLTMFEILFANWAPACRVLVDNVSEWFSLFFLFYRCVIGFAVINVINAVFVQQTLKIASSDEGIAYKQKQKDQVRYTQKVKKLFQSVDVSSDGNLTFDEFAQLVENPKLKFWMSQLELEYHDLQGLFEMLDDGDGEISLEEFVEGAGRLKGTAKTIDVWRLETKLEIMLGRILANTSQREDSGDLEQLFKNSGWSHMPVNDSQQRRASRKRSSVRHAANNSNIHNKNNNNNNEIVSDTELPPDYGSERGSSFPAAQLV